MKTNLTRLSPYTIVMIHIAAVAGLAAIAVTAAAVAVRLFILVINL